MTSIFQNTRSSVNVSILHDATLTDDNRNRFIRTAECFGQSVSFVDVSKQIFRISATPEKIDPITTVGAVYRLLIPDLLHISKVIYLDCDVVVNLDIAELWNVPIENRSLAVVREDDPDFYTTYEKFREWLLGCAPRSFFNSGVLLMNLSRIRQEHDLVQEMVCFLKRYSYIAHDPDQAFLNTLFSRDALFIEKRFNRYPNPDHPSDADSAVDNAILHYVPDKPWKSTQISLRTALFWRIFYESEWGDTSVAEPVLSPRSGYLCWSLLKPSLSRFPMHLRVKYITLYILHILGYIPPLLKEVCLRCFERHAS